MAHFAKLDDNNVVIEIHVVNNNELLDENGIEQESRGINFLINWCNGTHINWKQASYNGTIRKRYPSIGDTYSIELDAYIHPKPYPSWTLNLETLDWVSPVAVPQDDNTYYWDEPNQTWVLETEE